MASPEQTDELPELETAALEELGAEALAPVEPPAAQPDPFADLGGAQSQELAGQPEPQLDLAASPDLAAAPDLSASPDLAAAPDLAASPEMQAQPEAEPAPAAAPAKAATVSAKDLTDDILGGVDFDLPVPSAQAMAATPKIAPIQPKPIAPTPVASADGKPAAPAFAFKPATPAFASGGIPKPASPFGGGGSASPSPSPSPLFGSKPAGSPLAAVKPAAPPANPPPAGQVDPKSLFGDIGDLGGDDTPLAAAAPVKQSAEALREALLGDKPPAHLPPEALKLAFNLCRALIKKGVVSIDDLLT